MEERYLRWLLRIDWRTLGTISYEERIAKKETKDEGGKEGLKIQKEAGTREIR